LNRTLRSFSFAILTPLGFILETLIGEKHLFAGGENKLLIAIRTLQDLIVVFHTLLRGSRWLQSPQHVRPSQPVLGYVCWECVSPCRLVRGCSGKPVGRAVRLDVLIKFPPLLLAQPLA
jgi:hypothetical protein